MYRKLIFIFAIFCLLAPASGQAAVIINEVAWMGTASDANDEWIELYNNGGEAVDLTSWRLEAADGTPGISLGGTINSGGYFLLERTGDDTVPGVTANQIYSGAMSNEGETLYLKNNGGSTVDTAEGSGGWPAGDNTSKNTMQRAGSNWITAAATPGTANATETVEPPATTTDDGTGDNTSGGGGSSETEKNNAFSISLPKKYTVSLGSSAKFALKLSKGTSAGKVRWSFGDGSDARGLAAEHTYDFPGTYVVIVTARHGDEELTARSEVLVVDAAVEITDVVVGGKPYVELINQSNYELEMSGWRLESASSTFAFPEGMAIKSKGVLKISGKISNLLVASSVKLILPTGETVSTFDLAGVDEPREVVQVEPVETVEVVPVEVVPEPDLIPMPPTTTEPIPPLPPPDPVEPPPAEATSSLPSGLDQAAGPGLIELPKREWMDWVSLSGLKKLFTN